MRNRHLFLRFAGCCLAIVAFAAGAAENSGTQTSAESRVAAQNALLEEYYQAELKAHPERATAFGDYRYNDQLDDYSLAAISGLHANDLGFIQRYHTLSPHPS